MCVCVAVWLCVCVCVCVCVAVCGCVCGCVCVHSFGRVDLLFCNAGILPSSGLRWGVAARAVFTCSLGRFLETSRCVVSALSCRCVRPFVITFCPGSATENGHAFIANPVGLRTQAGFGLLFATHVLGHLSLVRGGE